MEHNQQIEDDREHSRRLKKRKVDVSEDEKRLQEGLAISQEVREPQRTLMGCGNRFRSFGVKRARSRMTDERCNVTFNERVTVAFIPLYSDYEDDVRNAMWCNQGELQRSKARNKLEFVADGLDWRQATEDEDMPICQESGERIHPVHFFLAAMKRVRRDSVQGPCERDAAEMISLACTEQQCQ